jgi:hypothetical protein
MTLEADAELRQMAAEKPRGLKFKFLAGATDLFHVAAQAVESTPAEPEKRTRDSNLIAVVFSALSVEAFLNELATLDYWQEQAPSLVNLDDRLKAMARVLELAEESNLQSPAKLLLAHEILGKPLDRGSSSFQEYHFLKQLRDSIVHAHPTTSTLMWSKPVEIRSSRQKLIDGLRTRGLLRAGHEKRGQRLLDWLSSPKLGEWAVRTAATTVAMTVEALPQGDFRDTTAILYREFVRAGNIQENSR